MFKRIILRNRFADLNSNNNAYVSLNRGCNRKKSLILKQDRLEINNILLVFKILQQ